MGKFFIRTKKTNHKNRREVNNGNIMAKANPMAKLSAGI
jgi:hypothetical protein